MAGTSDTPTPYRVICHENIMGEEGCGPSYLTQEEYDRQLMRGDVGWRCPQCGAYAAEFDDANYERHVYGT